MPGDCYVIGSGYQHRAVPYRMRVGLDGELGSRARKPQAVRKELREGNREEGDFEFIGNGVMAPRPT